MEEKSITNHHAFLYLSEDENVLWNLADFLKINLDFEINNNPDYLQKDTDTFGIDESRELKNWYSQKSLGEDGKKVCAVRTKFITNEAQNALLKILEEPNPNSYFFFILPSGESILPTLMSRFMSLRKMNQEEKKEKKISQFDMEKFLGLSIPARIRLLSEIIEDKDKNLAINFLNQLEVAYRNKFKLTELDEEKIETFKVIAKSRNYLNNRGSSIKLILENIAMVIPQK